MAEAPKPSIAKLLGDYARLMNEHGADSQEAESFFEQHAHNKEFATHAKLANALKKGLAARHQ
jgi:hypothetical protein